MYFKFFILSCSLLVAVQFTPIGGEEILQTNDEKENDAHRMLVWPPRIKRKNVSDDGDLRLIGGEPQEGLPSTIFRNSDSKKAEDRSDTNNKEETTLNSFEEKPKNRTQEINQTSKSGSQNDQVIKKNVRMTNWVNNLSKESSPGNYSVDIESIQLTTSEPQIIPSIETVAIFRNAGLWRNGNSSYSVEVEEIATNVTEETPRNQSQAKNGESILQHNLESPSVNAGTITTEEKDSKDKIEVKKNHISQSLEHNTEIYGKTVAEELAELSVIDVLLRKRRKVFTVERAEPEDDDSSKEISSNEQDFGEMIKLNQSNSSLEEHDVNTTLVNEPDNINNASTLEIISLKNSDNEDKSENSKPTLIVPSITLSEVRNVNSDTEILPQVETKLDLNNTNSTTIHSLEQTHSEVQPVYLQHNSSYHINTTSEPFVSDQKGREEKHESLTVESFGNNATATNKSFANKNQSINASPVIILSLSPNHGNKIKIISPNENIRRSDEGILEDSTESKIPIKDGPDNDTSSTPVLSLENSRESEPSTTTIVLPKYSATGRIDETINKHSIKEVNATTEVIKHNPSNISQSNIEGKNIHEIDQHHTESSTEAKVKTIINVPSTHNNYTETSNKTLATEESTVLPSERTSAATQKVITPLEKETEVKKETATEKGTIFEGFKSIAEYIGFSD